MILTKEYKIVHKLTTNTNYVMQLRGRLLISIKTIVLKLFKSATQIPVTFYFFLKKSLV